MNKMFLKVHERSLAILQVLSLHANANPSRLWYNI